MNCSKSDRHEVYWFESLLAEINKLMDQKTKERPRGSARKSVRFVVSLRGRRTRRTRGFLRSSLLARAEVDKDR